MSRYRLKPSSGVIVFLSLALALMSGMTAMAQGEIKNLRITRASSSKVVLKWDAVAAFEFYTVSYTMPSGQRRTVGGTVATTFTVKRLRSDTSYSFRVSTIDGRSATVLGSTLAETVQTPYAPPPETCPQLPPHVVVKGYMENTQCQIVDAAGVGQMDVIERGFISAVDVWNVMPYQVEVCMRGNGWMVLLDAEYAPRMAMELVHTHGGGFTCSVIDRAGTVVQVATGPPHHTQYVELPAQPEAQPETETATLPTFEVIPLPDCFIKLMDSLFLRATPAGEIIGIVWLNSEVHASEINGYWYKVEFEGKTGYISRYHRKVLHGGCG